MKATSHCLLHLNCTICNFLQDWPNETINKQHNAPSLKNKQVNKVVQINCLNLIMMTWSHGVHVIQCISKPSVVRRLVTSTFPVVFQTAFVVWANTELQHFVSRFSCQVFRREMGVAAIGVCVSMAKQQCEKVTAIYREHVHLIAITLSYKKEK